MGMSISSATSSNIAASGNSAWQQRAQSFAALGKALQSGNLAGAQSAFSSISAKASSQITANPSSPLAQLGRALQSGNLSAAQQAFGALAAQRHHGGRGDAGTDGSAGGAVQAATPSPATATTGNIVNLVA